LQEGFEPFDLGQGGSFFQGSLLRLPIRILLLQGGRVQAFAVGEGLEPALLFAADPGPGSHGKMHQQVEIVLGPQQAVAIVANLHRVAALRQDVQALVVGVVRDVFRHHRPRPTTEEAVAGVLSQPSLADSGGLVGSACPLTVPWLPCTTIQINNWSHRNDGLFAAPRGVRTGACLGGGHLGPGKRTAPAPPFLRTSKGAEIDLVLGGSDEGNEVKKTRGWVSPFLLLPLGYLILIIRNT